MSTTPLTAVETETAARLRVALARLARQLRLAASVEGLTPTQLASLGALVREGPLRASELARREHLNPTLLSRVVAHLADRGLVERRPDPDDRRAARLHVTEAGRELHARVRDSRTRALSRHLDQLPPEHAAALVAALPALEALGASFEGRRA